MAWHNRPQKKKFHFIYWNNISYILATNIQITYPATKNAHVVTLMISQLMNKCLTNQYMIYLTHPQVPSYDPESTITIPFNIHNFFNKMSHDIWNLWNVRDISKRFWSRRWSLWAGVSAKACIFPLWKWLLGLWRLTIRILRINSLPPPVDDTLSVVLFLLGALLVTAFFEGEDKFVVSGNAIWRIISLM